MKNINGFWLPDEDTYFTDKPNYEINDTNLALGAVNEFRTAIDVGAHCGYWTLRLSDKFKNVVGIEPIKNHFMCLRKNTILCKNVKLLNSAASDKIGKYSMKTFIQNSGKSKISDTDGDVIINAITVDSLNLTYVDFIKIDVEGHEKEVVMGAKETIKKYKPTIFVEIHENYNAIAHIFKSMGYKKIKRVNNNYIWKCV